VKLLGCDQLLAQVGGGVDEIPVLAVGAEGDRRLRALKLGRLVSRGPANLAAAIPLRYATARCSAKDDDAKHDPSPGKPITRDSVTELANTWETQTIDNDNR
jgi:hypothetical protein